MKIFGGRGAVYAAIALGMLTSYIAWRYVDQASQGGQAVQLTPVIVAAMDVPAREILTYDMLTIQQMPVQAVHPQAARSYDEIVGKVARSSFAHGEQILSSKVFLQRADSGLAFMVPDGMRAVSVGFTEVIGSGGMVSPGDHVDIIGVFEMKVPGPTSTSTATATTPRPVPNSDTAVYAPGSGNETVSVATMVLQDVSILAIAQRLEGEEPRSSAFTLPGSQTTSNGRQPEARAEATPQPQAKTATLAVKPEDALKLVLAEERGKIRLALRRANDDSTPKLAQVPLDKLLQSQ
jgi:pilus assembly protein CpaB